MSDEPTERDVEALVKVLATAERAAPFDFDAVGWKRRHDHQAKSLLASDWYAERVAQARREAAEKRVAAVEAVLGDIEADDVGGITAELIYDLRAALRGDS